MRMTKVWLMAIGVQFANLMILDGCQTSREVPDSCGNGRLEPGEECDDENETAGDGCSPNCTIEVCGNSILDPGEQCDDGNNGNGDGCSANCQFADCGNGILESGEQCDDGNQIYNDGCEVDCMLTPAVVSKTCAGLAAAANRPLVDGAYVLHFGGDSTKPWVAYCLDMAGVPKEYLQLMRTTGRNFSQYTAGGAVSGTNERTVYTKIKIDPSTLVVDTTDQAFASTSGSVSINGVPVVAMQYGSAGSCDSKPSGIANIDLQGTPFTISPLAFILAGFHPMGRVVSSANNQVMDLTGGGFCGVMTSASGTTIPLMYP